MSAEPGDLGQTFEQMVRRGAIINAVNTKWRKLRRRRRMQAWWWARIPAAPRIRTGESRRGTNV